jgi:hypothetical protein
MLISSWITARSSAPPISTITSISSSNACPVSSFRKRPTHICSPLIWREPGSSFSIVSGYGLDDLAIEVRSPADARDFPLTSVSRLALGLTHPPVQWVPGVVSPRVKSGWGLTLTTHPHLVPRSWMSRSCTASPPCASIGVLWGCFPFYLNMAAALFAETSDNFQHSTRLIPESWSCACKCRMAYWENLDLKRYKRTMTKNIQ